MSRTKIRQELVARWEDCCDPAMLLEPSQFGQIGGREDFRGFTWHRVNEDGLAIGRFLSGDATLANLDLSFADINPFRLIKPRVSNVYAADAKFWCLDWREANLTNCEFVRCEFKTPSVPFTRGHLSKCTFTACKLPPVLSWAATYDNCRIENMRITGPRGGASSRNPLITNTTVTGKWKEVELHQTVEGNQLAGCDLTGVDFGTAVFSYIDISQINVPDDIKRFTVINWDEVLPTITQAVEQILATTNEDSRANLHAQAALSDLERDLLGYHEEAPDRPRGARYCTELKDAEEDNFPELLELYKDAGAQFMLDPTATD